MTTFSTGYVDTDDDAVNLAVVGFVCILLLYVILGFNLEEKKRRSEALWLHESGPAILLGAALGMLSQPSSSSSSSSPSSSSSSSSSSSPPSPRALEISDKTFFYFVLPPIIFASGYGLKKKRFFRNLRYITAMGVLGTLVQFGITTVSLYWGSRTLGIKLAVEGTPGANLSLHECMIISSCLAATDSVAALSLVKATEFPRLAAVLFGEGVVNDAISILLFHSVVTTKRMTPEEAKEVWGPTPSLSSPPTTHHLAARAAPSPTPLPTSDDDDDGTSSTSYDDDVYLSHAPSLSLTSSPTSAPHHSSLTNAVLDWDMKILDLCHSALITLTSSLVIGVGSGLVVSRFLRLNPNMIRSPVHQTSVILLGAYLSFCLSDALHYSGVLTVFFAGVTMSHYAWHSLSKEAKQSTKATFGTMSHVAEAYCFAAVGVSLHRFTDVKQVSLPLIALAIVALLVGRAAVVFGVGWVAGCGVGRGGKLPRGEQSILYFGGLVRGAICWAQAIQVRDPHRHVMLSTVLACVLFTTLGVGTVLPWWVGRAGGVGWHAESSLRASPGPIDQAERRGLLARGGGGGDGGGDGGGEGGENNDDSVRSEHSGATRAGTGDGSILRNFDLHLMKPLFGGSPARRPEAGPTGYGAAAVEPLSPIALGGSVEGNELETRRLAVDDEFWR